MQLSIDVLVDWAGQVHRVDSDARVEFRERSCEFDAAAGRLDGRAGVDDQADAYSARARQDFSDFVVSVGVEVAVGVDERVHGLP